MWISTILESSHIFDSQIIELSQLGDKAANALALATSPVVRALVDPEGAMRNIRDLDEVLYKLQEAKLPFRNNTMLKLYRILQIPNVCVIFVWSSCFLLLCATLCHYEAICYIRIRHRLMIYTTRCNYNAIVVYYTAVGYLWLVVPCISLGKSKILYVVFRSRVVCDRWVFQIGSSLMVERAWVSNECGTLLHMHWVLSTATTLVHGVCLPFLPSLLRKLRHRYCGCSTAPRICDSMVLLQNTSLTKEEGTWDNKIMTNSNPIFLSSLRGSNQSHMTCATFWQNLYNLRPTRLTLGCLLILFFLVRNFVLLTGSTYGGVAVKFSMIIQQRVKLTCLDLLWPRWGGFHLLASTIWMFTVVWVYEVSEQNM